jgi:hypothetical protein
MGAYPSRLLIKAASSVLAALRGSTYGREYDFTSSLAAALSVERRVLACRGWAGENGGLSEQPANHDGLSEGIRVSRVSGDAAVSQYSASRTAAMPG